MSVAISNAVFSPDDGDAFGDVAVKDEILDGDESVDVDLSVDEGDSHQVVRLQLPKDDPLTDVRHQISVQLWHWARNEISSGTTYESFLLSF